MFVGFLVYSVDIIVKSELTNAEAEIFEVCWIHERTEQGEVLFQFADMPYNREEHQKMLDDYKQRKFKARIEIGAYSKRYFNIDGEYNFDTVEGDCLLKTHFLSSNWMIEPYTMDEKNTIRTFIEKRGGRVYTSVAKAALSVIEFGVLDYNKYCDLKEHGYKVYHSFNVLDFIKANETLLPLVNTKKKVNIPKYDEQVNAEMKEYLASIQSDIVKIANAYEDDGYKAECKAMDYEKDDDINNAIKYYEVSAYKKFDAPYVYKRLAIIYRKFGMFEDELRVIELGLTYVADGNTSRGALADRKRAVIEILEAI